MTTETARRRWSASIVWLVACLTPACEQRIVYAEYQGPEAFPNERPQFLAEGRTLGYVSDSLSDTISIVDIGAMQLVGQVPVGRDPVDIDGPHHLAVDAEAGALYVALSYPALGLTGPHAGHGGGSRFGYVQMLALDDLRPLGEMRVDQNPGDIVLSPNRETLAVTHYDVARLERETTLEAQRAELIMMHSPSHLEGDQPVADRVSVCITPHGVAFAADSRHLYVACTGEDTVVVADAEHGEVLDRVPVAEAIGAPGSPIHQPYAIAVSPAGDQLAVSNIGADTLVLFDIVGNGAALERRFTVPMLGAAFFPAFSPDGRELIVPFQNPGGAVRIDVATGRLVEQVTYSTEQCERPHETATTNDGRTFLVCEGNLKDPGTVVRIDPGSLEILDVVPVGVYPDRLVIVEP